MGDKKAQERTCPLCGRIFQEEPALSRADGVTPIFPDCGVREALDCFGVTDKDEQQNILDIIHNQTSG